MRDGTDHAEGRREPTGRPAGEWKGEFGGTGFMQSHVPRTQPASDPGASPALNAAASASEEPSRLALELAAWSSQPLAAPGPVGLSVCLSVNTRVRQNVV